MSSTIEMQCPGCEESLKIPSAVLGKKIKCKICSHAFVVEDPDAKPKVKPAKPAKPTKAAKAAEKPAAPSPPPPPEPKNSQWDDDDAQDVQLINEEDIARCPHCAKELDPPDAVVCIHCGFNNRTRAKADLKRTWEPDFMEWFIHLLPGILALTLAIGLIVLNVLVILNMRTWLTGSFLESDDIDASGRKKFYIAPGAFIFLIGGFSIPMFVPLAVFAFKRLAINYRPSERIRK